MGKRKKEEMYMNRSRAAECGQETLRILQEEAYTSPLGHHISLGAALDQAVSSTISYPPRTSPGGFLPADHETKIKVTNETTLEAASALVDEGYHVALLNFASAKHPGGGFQKGSRAQEESLARSSGLFACIDGNPMYSYHRQQKDCLYSNYAIYSPDVPVFRLDDGSLLEQPYTCGMITSPAVNAGIVLQRNRRRGDEITATMRERIDKILAIAAHHQHDALVLGAWGCGVFQNSSETIAGLFAEALSGTYARQFAAITFAILDASKEKRFIGPFEKAFA